MLKTPEAHVPPFSAFVASVRPRTLLRDAITSACRRPEPECIRSLLPDAELSTGLANEVTVNSRRLVAALRSRARSGGVEGLIHEYSLSSQEGVALMCLAEALLRIPDNATRDALIRDKIAHGDWKGHLGQSSSLFVNAATWGLVVTGKLTATTNETSLAASLNRLLSKGGEPLIRRGTDLAMRMMGEQFVTGQTIEEALANSRSRESDGFQFSYDMLGEAAATAEDAARYLAAYERAIEAIGRASAGRGIYEGPGISIKLSALHPRYSRAQRERVIDELLPRVTHLASLAKNYDIGLNLDAEEQDRLELSLDILESLAVDPTLSGWNGLGFVVQAYGKRCPFVIDWIVDLARRSRRRIMVRLVKGAYWDSEIKRAQVDGHEGFPVFTRKVHTDVSYLACARKLLAVPDAAFPQFATHNAQTLATIVAMAGPNFYRGQYEFQCLHGMGEPLYGEVVGPTKLNRPCRIYAPVGSHETLLAYLVRRLLENGANSSFVNRIADEQVPVDDLVEDPVAVVKAMADPGSAHERIALPRDLFGNVRPNSSGFDLSDEHRLFELARALQASLEHAWKAEPTTDAADEEPMAPVLNPADRRDVIGRWRPASAREIENMLATAASAAPAWATTQAQTRATALLAAADAVEARMPVLIGLMVREAGKSFSNAVAEIREAIDFLRYYATEAVRTLGNDGHAPLGPVVCISPWNFPLAIFTGQVAAALAAGNVVLAKPAEETPLIAAEAVRLFQEAGIPRDILQLVPGAGEVGAALVGDRRVQGVIFTGSGSVARLIQRQLASRLTTKGQPILLVAETGGQNALVVDSSALAEQVVADVIASAFDSAGQRCSALRILCLQEEIADRTLAMLRGAMRELAVGNPDRLSTDIGPVITPEAEAAIEEHVRTMRARGHGVWRLPLSDDARHGTFVAPTLIDIGRIADVEREVFGPVLHVLRFRREELDRLIDEINGSGFGLTFGLHTRIDETIARVVDRVEAGNVYINRNIIGAVVGVQPFGGSGLSGTGPKAGGPLYLVRLLAKPPAMDLHIQTSMPASAPAVVFANWLRSNGRDEAADRVLEYVSRSAIGIEEKLPGPVGELNIYSLRPRGAIVAIAQTETGLLLQVGAILATGNKALVAPGAAARSILSGLPKDLSGRVEEAAEWRTSDDVGTILFEGDGDDLRTVIHEAAERDGKIVQILALSSKSLADGENYELVRLLEERTVSTNTAAAGGNASLMSIG